MTVWFHSGVTRYSKAVMFCFRQAFPVPQSPDKKLMCRDRWKPVHDVFSFSRSIKGLGSRRTILSLHTVRQTQLFLNKQQEASGQVRLPKTIPSVICIVCHILSCCFVDLLPTENIYICKTTVGPIYKTLRIIFKNVF